MLQPSAIVTDFIFVVVDLSYYVVCQLICASYCMMCISSSDDIDLPSALDCRFGARHSNCRGEGVGHVCCTRSSSLLLKRYTRTRTGEMTCYMYMLVRRLMASVSSW